MKKGNPYLSIFLIYIWSTIMIYTRKSSWNTNSSTLEPHWLQLDGPAFISYSHSLKVKFGCVFQKCYLFYFILTFNCCVTWNWVRFGVCVVIFLFYVKGLQVVNDCVLSEKRPWLIRKVTFTHVPGHNSVNFNVFLIFLNGFWLLYLIVLIMLNFWESA